MQSLAQLDREGFIAVLSGLDLDAEWSVRASLASVLGDAAREMLGLPRLRLMLDDRSRG